MWQLIAMVVGMVIFVPLALYMDRRRSNAWKEAADLLKIEPQPLEKHMLHHLAGVYRDFSVVAWHREETRGRHTERSTILGARLSAEIWRDLILEPVGVGARLKDALTGAKGITIDDEEFDKGHRILGKVHEGTYRALRDRLVQVQFLGLQNSFTRYWMKGGVLFVEQEGDMADPYKLVMMLDRVVDRAKVLDQWEARNLTTGGDARGASVAEEVVEAERDPVTGGAIW